MKVVTSVLLLLTASLIASLQIILETTVLNERVVVNDLDIPWDMTYGPDGYVWYTELSGKISRLNIETDEVQLIHQVPDVELFVMYSIRIC